MELLWEFFVWLHVVLIIVWLGTDVVVFFLSLSVLNRSLPLAIRLDRAHVAEQIDRWVVISFLLTMPLGLALTHMGGYSILETPWLRLKVIFFGIIILVSIGIITGATGTTQSLKRIAAGEGDIEALEAQLRRRVLVMAPPVLLIYACVLANIFIALNRHRW